MKGDIAHRSIRSSISRIVPTRAPRTISSVMGSTRNWESVVMGTPGRVEERPGFPGALRALGGLGGPFEAPHLNSPDRRHAQVDQLDRRSRQIVRVETPMLAMKRLDQRVETRTRERAIAERARQLEALVLVPEIGRALETLKVARHLF